MSRDNFTKKTIETLKARVAHRCSNPNCRVPTSAPAEDNQINNIGIAAHIFAASEGGPRSNNAISSEERKSIDNGIWLCSNCSIDIDRDEKRYPPKLLKKWKADAEAQARIELGQKLPSNTDAIDTVTAALTGMPKNFITRAIPNVHQATESSLNKLDPRFHIKTQYIEGNTSIGIFAKENVPLALKVDAEYVQEFAKQHKMLIEHGDNVIISTNGLTIEGSKLFEEIMKEGGTFSISSPKKKAIQKLWLVQDDTNLIESFDDIQGEVSWGTKSFTFNGSACDGIFSLSYKKETNDNKQVTITISLSTDLWEGSDIQLLPYFNKIFSLFDKMAEGWTLSTSLEIDGLNILNSEGMKVSTWDYVLYTNSFLHYVYRCKTIANKFNFQVNYTSEISFTTDEHMNIADIVEIIEEKKSFNSDKLAENAHCTLLADDKCQNIEKLTNLTDPITIRMSQKVGDTIKLFNEEFFLPPKTVYISGVLPKFHSNPKDIKPNDSVKIEWMPQDDFHCLICYNSNLAN
ncbi:hypothetical protein SG34_033295 [Thalassomonas viridans]|uniref:Uncharacterized protein n=1 Tax=Thalassomonas viridans TaxID=137584 RepID=A0AAE9ZEC9_9GAMM|nr:hypothetical protein [Thalassomonas viridans]WDE08777.1 hypothetical protein SG34_033295 [Thalassomonas viridans]